MPRPSDVAPADVLTGEDLRPLMGDAGPDDLTSAFFFISTRGNSTRLRELIIAKSQFPLQDDLPAFLIVNQLIYRGATRPTDLADAIDTGKSNVSRVVRRLESASLVRRVADPADNRAVVVTLTAAGRQVGERILTAGRIVNETPIHLWSASDQKNLTRLMTKLADSLKETPLGAP